MPHGTGYKSKSKQLTASQKSTLKKHSKHHNAAHMAIMRRLMMRGFSFKKAHAMALKLERTPHREKPVNQRQSQRIVINMGGGRATKENPRGVVQPFVGSVNNSDTLFNQMSAAVEQARARENTAYNQRQNVLRNNAIFRQDITTPNRGAHVTPMNYYSDTDLVSRQRRAAEGAYQAGTLESLGISRPEETDSPVGEEDLQSIMTTGAPEGGGSMGSTTSLPRETTPRSLEETLSMGGLRHLKGGRFSG